jgi:hypothetical protein
MDFRLKDGEQVRTVKCTIASATVIEAGDLVTLDAGLVVKAAANSARVAWAPNGSANGETEIDVTVGNDFTLQGTSDENFAAATHKGAEVDLVVDTGTQLVDVGESTTDVFRVGVSQDAGTEGAKTNVEVRINKPLF